MSPPRWLTWTPEASIMEKTPVPELTKPTKPDFVSFVGPKVGAFPIIEASEFEQSPIRTWPFERQPRQDFDPLWGDPCPCGFREWWKLPGPVLKCKACGCVVQSKYWLPEAAEVDTRNDNGTTPAQQCYVHPQNRMDWWCRRDGSRVCGLCTPNPATI